MVSKEHEYRFLLMTLSMLIVATALFLLGNFAANLFGDPLFALGNLIIPVILIAIFFEIGRMILR